MNALGASYDDDFDALDKLYALTGAKIPTALDGIREKEIVHKNTVQKNDMPAFVLNHIGKE